MHVSPLHAPSFLAPFCRFQFFFDIMSIAPYRILMSRATWDNVANPYFDALKPTARRIVNGENIGDNDGTPGVYFRKQISDRFAQLEAAGFPEELAMLHCLLNTKLPTIFAESHLVGHGLSDWNQAELDIMGDVGIAVPVTIFDNGRHIARAEDVHRTPFEGTLLYVPGLLFESGAGREPCDFAKAAFGDYDGDDAEINEDGFYQTYERRLLPSFLYANLVCEQSNKKGVVTIPGLGCGMFAGPFENMLGEYLQAAIYKLLQQHHSALPHIKAVYFDPYNECTNAEYVVGHIKYLVRPLAKNNYMKPQLCHPSVFEEQPGDDYGNCHLFSFVAWDHVSWPGNDYWKGSRTTDDGVKAAATSSMYAMTGIQGEYDAAAMKYMPPAQFDDWWEVVDHHKLEIQVTRETLLIL
jgi:hypothetical protein